MAKIAITISIDEKVERALQWLSLPENENRNISNLGETLFREALKARGIDVNKFTSAKELNAVRKR